MKSFLPLILLSLFPFANMVSARKDPGEYWTTVMKYQPIPDAIQGLIPGKSLSNCHEEKPFVKKIEPRPNVTTHKDEDEKSFVKDFEPRPNLTSYHEDDKQVDEKSFVKDFDPRPDATVYNE